MTFFSRTLHWVLLAVCRTAAVLPLLQHAVVVEVTRTWELCGVAAAVTVCAYIYMLYSDGLPYVCMSLDCRRCCLLFIPSVCASFFSPVCVRALMCIRYPATILSFSFVLLLFFSFYTYRVPFQVNWLLCCTLDTACYFELMMVMPLLQHVICCCWVYTPTRIVRRCYCYYIIKYIFKDVSCEFDGFRVNTHLCKLRCWYLKYIL